MEKTIDSMDDIKTEYIGHKVHPYLVEYSKTFLSIHAPKFIDLKISKDVDRKKDQWRGIPYTSESWPWPTSRISGKYLSPAIQLDLARISILLNLNLGDGILQVWFDEINWENRIIARIYLSEPESASVSEFLESNYMFEFDTSYYLDWIPSGIMYPRVLNTFPSLLDQVTDNEWGAQEALDELISERLPVRIDTSRGEANAQLGGYWYCIGNHGGGAEWPVDPNLPNFGMKSRVIFHMADSMDTSFLIVAEFDENARKVHFLTTIVHA